MVKKKTIYSVNDSQHEILKNILELYCPDGFEIDVTYNKGSFYKKGVPKPRLKLDLHPQSPDVYQNDITKKFLGTELAQNIVFDPPFLCGKSTGKNTYIMNERYSSFHSLQELKEMYSKALVNIHAYLKKKGILIVKCQDTVNGGQNHFNHIFVHDEAIKLGFEAIDLFISINRNPIVSKSQKRQLHSRKNHSYFFVFRKKSRFRKKAAATKILAVGPRLTF